MKVGTVAPLATEGAPTAELRALHRRGARLTYRLLGEGQAPGGAHKAPLVVLIQGLGLSGTMWGALPARLAQDGFSVLTPDNRGTGGSRDAPLPLHMATLADDIAAMIADVQGEESAHGALCVGISMGGMIAQHVALRHREKVAGLLLAATSCGAPYARLAAPRDLLRLVGACLRKPGSVNLDDLVFHPKTLGEASHLVDDWNLRVSREPTSTKGIFGQLLAAATHAAGFSLGSIDCPAEIVTGDDDRLVPTSNARVLATRISDSRLTIVPDAGHAFPLEHPEVLPSLIRRLHRRVRETRPS